MNAKTPPERRAKLDGEPIARRRERVPHFEREWLPVERKWRPVLVDGPLVAVDEPLVEDQS